MMKNQVVYYNVYAKLQPHICNATYIIGFYGDAL